jgi:hypothetical protein
LSGKRISRKNKKRPARNELTPKKQTRKESPPVRR